MQYLPDGVKLAGISLLLWLIYVDLSGMGYFAASVGVFSRRDSLPAGAVEDNTEKWRFERIRRPETPPGVWEISGRILPWSQYGYGYTNAYTTEATAENNYPRTFTDTDGTPLMLFPGLRLLLR